MSELNNKMRGRRWRLLGSVSALALIAGLPGAVASEDRPILWLELGGTAESVSGTGDRFTPPFTLLSPVPAPYSKESPIDAQQPPRFTYGGEGALTFQPEDSDWQFSAAVRYGRSNNKRDTHHQTPLTYKIYDVAYKYYPSVARYITRTSANYAETIVNQSEHHLIVDFQAGKDVGLGMFGHNGSSVLSAGVRVARFDFHSDVTIRARPTVIPTLTYVFGGLIPIPDFRWDSYYHHGSASRSFHGIGPSLSWKASEALFGNAQDGELSLDFGVNGALLFGKQKSRIHHHTTARHYGGYKYEVPVPGYPTRDTHYVQAYPPVTANLVRSRTVMVPNLGASIGISYRVVDAKLSLGYRADYFFGAMDGGIDAANKTSPAFNGLYASISIGLGD